MKKKKYVKISVSKYKKLQKYAKKSKSNRSYTTQSGRTYVFHKGGYSVYPKKPVKKTSKIKSAFMEIGNKGKRLARDIAVGEGRRQRKKGGSYRMTRRNYYRGDNTFNPFGLDF